MGLFNKTASPPGMPIPPRSRTGESIRGKISGPIPIPDDEFPMRNPGTGIATSTPLPEDNNNDRQWPADQQVMPDTAEAGGRGRNVDSVVGPSGPGSIKGSIQRSSPQSQRRTNPPSTLRHSVISENTDRSVTSKDKPQRKKSTLGGVFSRLFGKKKKKASISTTSQRASTLQRPSQHHSDPSPLKREPAKETESKRSASLPITEYDRALRSHSVGPNDMVAIESARNSMHADFNLGTRRRAATATSHLFRHRDGELAGLSPRPASTHNIRTSRSFHDDDHDPNEIGRAITSDITGHKRRSRSLSGLEDGPDGRSTYRRRSDEIRYWRESYDPGYMSPISSGPPDHDQDDTGALSVDMPLPSGEAEQPPKPPLQPFDFGNMTPVHLKEMAGMKITQAASLETRVGTLEERMRRIEQRVGRLGIPRDPQVGAEPPTRPAPAVPNHTARASSHYTGSLHSRESQLSIEEPVPLPQATQLSVPPGKNRPHSGSTIKEDTAGVPPMGEHTGGGPFTSEHYATLLALLEMERAARLTLEAQVRRLTQRLDALAPASGTKRRSSVHLEPPPTARSFGNVSAWDHDDSDDENRRGVKNRAMAAEDSGIATGSTTGVEDDDYSEHFATPREENPYGYGVAIGDDLTDDEEEKRRKAARTLSLSQLTLGRAHPKAVI